jgi:protein TonB
MNYSLGTPVRPPAKHEPPRQANLAGLSMGPAAPGPMDATPFGEITGANVGPDWRNELSAWVHQHAYYPEQAIRNDESGDSTVVVVANPDGRVTSVELETKSGSPWLDMALMALFRDAKLPHLPPAETQPVTFHFTMRYILLRR